MFRATVLGLVSAGLVSIVDTAANLLGAGGGLRMGSSGLCA